MVGSGNLGTEGKSEELAEAQQAHGSRDLIGYLKNALYFRPYHCSLKM
jgi:hypothetical protein